jgi:hypothetical protein
MASDNTHLVSITEYGRRSALITDHITTQMSTARFDGPRAGSPGAQASGLEFQPVPGFVAHDSAAGGAGQVRDVDLSAVAPASARAAVVTLQVSSPAANGYATAYGCDAAPPIVSNLNYAAGRVRSAQAVAALSATRHLCVLTSASTALRVVVHGWFVQAPASRLTPLTPTRLLDTRQSGRAASFALPMPAGAAAVALNVTSVGASPGGTIAVFPCDSPGEAPAEVSFGPGEVIGSSMYVRPSAAGTVCVEARTAGGAGQVDVVVDLASQFSPAGALRLTLAAPQRMLDTRFAAGGWNGRHGAGQTIDTLTAPPGAQAVTGSLTMIRPAFNGHIRATACGLPTPPTAAVNAPAGQVIVNSTTMGVSADQLLCLYASASTNTVFDVTGWWTS